MKFMVSNYHYVQCDATHVKSYCHYTYEQAPHIRDCHMYTRWVHVRELLMSMNVKAKKPKTSEMRSNFKEVVLEKSE